MKFSTLCFFIGLLFVLGHDPSVPGSHSDWILAIVFGASVVLYKVLGLVAEQQKKQFR